MYQSVSTVSGTLPGFLNGKATEAQFYSPCGVCVDKHGNIMVADCYNRVIRRISNQGDVTTLASSDTLGFRISSQIHGAFGVNSVCVDDDGNIIFTDNPLNRIHRINVDGSACTLAGSTPGFRDGRGEEALFFDPLGICVDKKGNVFVADCHNHRIRQISTDGNVTTLAGSIKGFRDGPGTDAMFAYPVDVCVDRDGDIIVVDNGNNLLRRIRNGIVSTIAGSSMLSLVNGNDSKAQMKSIRGICVDRENNIIIVDNGNNCIRQISANGIVSTIAGSSIEGFLDGNRFNAQFNGPLGICVDIKGNLIVADSNNHRIRRIQSGSDLDQELTRTDVSSSSHVGKREMSDKGESNILVKTLSGLGGEGGFQDGNLANALFNGALGICVDKNGNILIADSMNHCIRQISLSSYEVITFAGSGGKQGFRNGKDALFHSPSGVCIDTQGNLIVADTNNHCIRRIWGDRSVTTIAGIVGKGGHRDGKNALFQCPRGVCIDSNGDIIVTDTYNHCIRRITPDGTVTTIAGTVKTNGHCDGNASEAKFYFPTGICLAWNENLIVADSGNHCIRAISVDDEVSTFAGTAGLYGHCDNQGVNALFYQPHGVCFDKDGCLLVTDSYNYCLRRITQDGNVTTIAGMVGHKGHRDGSKAIFRFPMGVCQDFTGQVLVTDSHSHCIRQILTMDEFLEHEEYNGDDDDFNNDDENYGIYGHEVEDELNGYEEFNIPHEDPTLKVDILSSVRARVNALSMDLERIDFTHHLVDICSKPGPVLNALNAMQAPARLNILKIDATKAFNLWQDTAKNVEKLSAMENVSIDDLDAAINIRNTAAIDANTKITSAADSASIALHFDATTTTSAITDATVDLERLVRDYERLFGLKALREARFSGAVDDAVRVLRETKASGSINGISLDHCSYVQLENSAKTDSSLPARLSALNSLMALARDGLASLTPNISPAEQHELVVQDSECLSRQLALVVQSQDLAIECARLRALWPEKEKAEKTAKQMHLQAKHAIEYAEAEGEVPTKEAEDRLTERLRKKTEAVCVNESLRAQARTLITNGCPEARYLLSIMTPRTPTTAYPTDFDKLWAELLEAGVASSFRREDFTDTAALPHSSGRVVQARLRNTEERTVLKAFSRAPGAMDLTLFINEVRLLQKLRHPNILALHSVLADRDYVYLRLPWVEGGSLREWLLSTESRAPLARVRTFAGVAAALAYIHASGVIHRDLKPENILMGGDGVPRLCDFGISLSSASNTTLLQATGAGTDLYKSPEQLKGEQATSMCDQYALGLLLHELVFDTPYSASLEQRRDKNDVTLPNRLPADWPEPLVETARFLLRRLLSLSPYDRPSANAVLADPFCDRITDLASATSIAAPTVADTVITVRRQLATAITNASRRPSTDDAVVLPTNDSLFAIFATAMHASCAESDDISIPWRFTLSLQGGGDLERALDAVFAASMRSELGLFVTANDEGAGPVFPAVPCVGADAGTHADGLFAVGAALAQAALQGCFELDALGRLPEIAFFCLAHGPDEFLRKYFLTLPRALAALEQYDPDKARIFRELLQGTAEDYGIEARNWLGTPEVVTDANKYDLVRRECEEICVHKRWDAWKHLYRGWLAGGGNIVTAECKKVGLESVRQLVYDPEATQRRRAQVAASVNLSSQERAALNIKLCPYCGFPVEKIDGCDQMVCGRDAHGSARFAGGCGEPFKWTEARS